jgi:hypothetical protein
MAYIDPFEEPNDPLVVESARIDRELKAIFTRETEHFARQLKLRGLKLNDRGLGQTELNLREFLNQAIASIEEDVRGEQA